jgi:hypothetical protein
MSTTDANTDTSTESPEVGTIDMKLEVVTLPVSDQLGPGCCYRTMVSCLGLRRTRANPWSGP